MAIQSERRRYLKMKALYYLYEKGYTQTDIAKLLGISRVTLGRLLDEARKEGMVKIEIVDVRGTLQTLKMEEILKQRFHLYDTKLVDCAGLDKNALTRRLASEAAVYIEGLLKSGMKLGFTWGFTLNAMVENLNVNRSIKDLNIYTLVGGSSDDPIFQPNILAQQAVQKYGGSTHIITAPFICQTAELCRAIKEEPQIAAILKASRHLDLTMVGIGEEPLRNSDRLSHYPFDRSLINELADAGAVGDICGIFFDINGKVCSTSLNGRIVSIDITELPLHKKVIGVAGGPAKIRSVLGALNGGYLDVLITDAYTGRDVLKLAGTLPSPGQKSVSVP